MKKLLLSLVVAISIFAKSQKVFSVPHMEPNVLKVYVTSLETQADLKVYKVAYENQIGNNDGKWFFTKYANQAQKKVLFVKTINQADLIIFFAKYPNNAGWRNKSKQYLLY
ncbi:DUF6150 family protein [Chryseobacterium sp.]|uniref:DUF6150 family protein n=1 Tax=Chryseobacterium sp. TaxID=1871047 RepID=UPI00289B8892|nr:DUF6150 family protein [Chryseobacterium sp.]